MERVRSSLSSSAVNGVAFVENPDNGTLGKRTVEGAKVVVIGGNLKSTGSG
jgi:hypothetical protein